MNANLALLSAVLFLIQATSAIPINDAETCGQGQADVIFVLDESGSIWPPDFQKQLKFVENLVDRFAVSANGTRIGIETFGTAVRTIVSLGQINDGQELKRHVNVIRQRGGNTATHLALKRLREMFAGVNSRHEVSKVAIVITDGESDIPKQTALEAEEVRAQGIVVFAIGVGGSVKRTELESIASQPDYVFTVQNYDELDSILFSLTSKACPEPEKETPTTSRPTQSLTTKAWPGPAPANRTEEWATIAPTTPADCHCATDRPVIPKTFEGCTDSMIFNVYFGFPDQLSTIDSYLALQFIRHITLMLKGTPSFIRPYLVPRICFAPTTYPEAVDPSNFVDFLAALETRRADALTRNDLQLQYIRKQEEAYRRQYRNGEGDFRSAIAVLTVDNHPSNVDRILEEISYARREGIQVVMIGVGDYVDRNELQKMATSDRDVIMIHSYNYLPLISENLLQRVCVRGLLSSGRNS